MVTFFEVIASLMYVIERQRAFLYRTFGKFVIRPYIDFVYELPTEEQIEVSTISCQLESVLRKVGVLYVIERP